MNDIIRDSMIRWGNNALLDPLNVIDVDEDDSINIYKLKKIAINPKRVGALGGILNQVNHLDEIVINIPNTIDSHIYIDELKYAGDALEIIHIHGYEPLDDIDDLLNQFDGLEYNEEEDDIEELMSGMKRAKIGGRESNRRVPTSSLLYGLQYVKNLKSLTLNTKYVYNGLKELIRCKNLRSLIIDNIQDLHSVKNVLQIPKIETFYIKSGCCRIAYDDVTAITYNISKRIEDEMKLHTRLEGSTGEKLQHFKQIEAQTHLKHLCVDNIYNMCYWSNITNLQTFKYDVRNGTMSYEATYELRSCGIRVIEFGRS
jgi:hypothetical protein